MISVLIPVYNYKVTNLVLEIQRQLVIEGVDFEIICIDDCSTKFKVENSKLNELKNVEIIELKKNIGRSKIRNVLEEKSKFNWLLFLDSDVIPQQNNFIKNYIEFIRENEADIYCGGIVYSKEKPSCKKKLRWVYGIKREELTSELRNKNRYSNFLGSNFLIQRSVFEKVKFNSEIIKYGYEDTIFGEDLRKLNISILHIDNSVFHLGIEDSEEFLMKTKQALENLKILDENNYANEDFFKILKVYNSFKTKNLILY